MNETQTEVPSLIMDVRGLREWAGLSENEAGAIVDLYSSNQLVVATQTWNEFSDAYPDLAQKLDVPTRKRVTQADRLAAASLADNSPATPLSLAAKAGDFCVAGIAIENDLTVVTCASQKNGLYKRLSVPALTIIDVLAG